MNLLLPTASKREWRRWARARRAGLPDVSAQVCAHLETFLAQQGAAVVLAYRALPGEVDVSFLSERLTLLTSRAHLEPTPHLSLHAWHSATEQSRFGIMEPPLDEPAVDLSAVDTVLLPGLAFDDTGVRLGYGGGFYDRLLAGWTGRTVGVAADALVVPRLPREAHDLTAQWLVSEAGVRRAGTA